MSITVIHFPVLALMLYNELQRFYQEYQMNPMGMTRLGGASQPVAITNAA